MQSYPLVLLGVGGVGRALLQQIVENRSAHADRFGLRLNVIAVADSSGAVVSNGSELDDQTLLEVVALKSGKSKLAEHKLGKAGGDPLKILQSLQLNPTNSQSLAPVVVDCTATAGTVPALLYALEQNSKVVLANKKPLTVEQEVYNRLSRAGLTTGAQRLDRARWETTCGAALPVIVTLNRLMLCGDSVTKIAGTFSGTLGYVMTGLQAGKKFSEVVREAHRLGYTEPDPRDDLGGVDVARKALILARGMGWQMELSDVTVEGLYPLSMDGISVAQFLEATTSLDEYFATKVKNAAKEGKVLRFAATVENGKCRVGPTLVSVESPLGRLGGTDNLVELTTRWYNPNPLVVQGRGAGVDATASGVLADVMELAYTK